MNWNEAWDFITDNYDNSSINIVIIFSTNEEYFKMLFRAWVKDNQKLFKKHWDNERRTQNPDKPEKYKITVAKINHISEVDNTQFF